MISKRKLTLAFLFIIITGSCLSFTALFYSKHYILATFQLFLSVWFLAALFFIDEILEGAE